MEFDPGTASADPEIVEWLLRTFKRGRVTRIALVQSTTHGDQRVLDWADEELRRSPAELAIAILETAEKDSKYSRGQSLRYGVLAYVDDEETFRYRHFLRVDNPEPFVDQMGEDTANNRGIVEMLMRHTEAAVRLGMQAQFENNRMLMKRLADMENAFNRMLPVNMKLVETMEVMLDRKQERDIKLLKEKNAERRKSEAFEAFKMVIPIVLSKLLPGMDKGAMQKLLAEDQIQALLESLTQEQFQKFASDLNTEQRIAFVEFYRMYVARKNAQKAAGDAKSGIPDPPPAEEKKDG